MAELSQPRGTRPSRCRGLNLFEVIALMLISGGLAYGFMRGFDRGLWEAVVGAAIGAGGTLMPYLRYRAWRRWEPDPG